MYFCKTTPMNASRLFISCESQKITCEPVALIASVANIIPPYFSEWITCGKAGVFPQPAKNYQLCTVLGKSLYKLDLLEKLCFYKSLLQQGKRQKASRVKGLPLQLVPATS